MKLYSTIRQAAEAEQTIEKSRFIAHIMPVTSKEEADEHIARIRKEYRDATHNVPALVIGDKMQLQWGSDDGEPQGTSGAPMVQLLVNEGITNVLVVVTRYFGGIKLGPGGLVRAYTSSAKLALEKAGVCDAMECVEFVYRFDYSFLTKIQNAAKEGDYSISEIEYDDMVNAKITLTPENSDRVKSTLENITSGKGTQVGEVRNIISFI